MLLDDSSNGCGAMLEGVFVGLKPQIDPRSKFLLNAFAPEALGNGLKFDSCKPANNIWFRFRYLTDCTVYGALFGQAIL